MYGGDSAEQLSSNEHAEAMIDAMRGCIIGPGPQEWEELACCAAAEPIGNEALQ